jgi:nitrite reductase (NAD(P)H)
LLQKLRRVILDDELGICKDLDALMDNLINTYEDEWAAAIKGEPL